MSNKNKFVLIAVFSFLVTGCCIFGDKDDAPPPKKVPDASNQITVCDDAFVTEYRTGLGGVDRDYIFHYSAAVRKGADCSGKLVPVDRIWLYDMSNQRVMLGNREHSCYSTSHCKFTHHEDNRRGDELCMKVVVIDKGKEIYRSSKWECRSSRPVNRPRWPF